MKAVGPSRTAVAVGGRGSSGAAGRPSLDASEALMERMRKQVAALPSASPRVDFSHDFELPTPKASDGGSAVGPPKPPAAKVAPQRKGLSLGDYRKRKQ